jgi:transformer-2 protein
VARGRSRSRSPVGRSPGGANGSTKDRDSGRDRDRDDRGGRDYRSPPPRRRTPPPKRTPVVGSLCSIHDVSLSLLQAPNPSSVLGVFGLSIRTRERDLDDEFSRFGRVENVTIVYDQRVGLAVHPGGLL